MRVVLLDRDLEGLALAGAACRACPDILRVCADATALPFRDEGVDVITASLVLHHLSPDAAVASLEAMRAAARLGVVVNDLLRTRLAWLLVVVGHAALRPRASPVTMARCRSGAPTGPTSCACSARRPGGPASPSGAIRSSAVS